MLQTLLLSALSVAREREQGTFDQLLVTPFTPMQILIGKALPSILVGLVQSTTIFLIIRFWFQIPMSGSVWLLYLGLFTFTGAAVGIGLSISALSVSMQQAMLYTFLLIMPLMLLSGLMSPVSNMPRVLQIADLRQSAAVRDGPRPARLSRRRRSAGGRLRLRADARRGGHHAAARGLAVPESVGVRGGSPPWSCVACIDIERVTRRHRARHGGLCQWRTEVCEAGTPGAARLDDVAKRRRVAARTARDGRERYRRTGGRRSPIPCSTSYSVTRSRRAPT